VTAHHVGPRSVCPGTARTASVHSAHSRGAVTP
jgi:hypothetical protein